MSSQGTSCFRFALMLPILGVTGWSDWAYHVLIDCHGFGQFADSISRHNYMRVMAAIGDHHTFRPGLAPRDNKSKPNESTSNAWWHLIVDIGLEKTC